MSVRLLVIESSEVYSGIATHEFFAVGSSQVYCGIATEGSLAGESSEVYSGIDTGGVFAVGDVEASSDISDFASSIVIRVCSCVGCSLSSDCV